MRRKNCPTHEPSITIIIIACTFLFRRCDAFTPNEDPSRPGSRSVVVGADLLQQLSHDAAVLKSPPGAAYDLPTGSYPEQLSKYRYGDDYGGGYLYDKLPLQSHVERDLDLGIPAPFEIEIDDRIDPYELVNIDQTDSARKTAASAATVATATTPAKMKATKKPPTVSELPKRRGEMEYATFVNQPSMRTKQQQSQVNVLPVVQESQMALAKSKGVTGSDFGDTIFYAVAGVCSLAAVLGIVFASFSFARLRNQYKQSQMNEFPSFGFGGLKKTRSPDSVVAMDSKLASAAQLYHFQHTKQQIISMENPACDTKEAVSDDSELEEDEGDYSVYECPGLAPTGNMEINNPIFLKAKNGSTTPSTKGSDTVVNDESTSADIHSR